MKIITNFLILIIKFYKFFISPYIPSSCRYLPTCSDYFIDSLKEISINKEFYKTQYEAVGNGDYKHKTFHFSSKQYFKLSDSIISELSDLVSK